MKLLIDAGNHRLKWAVTRAAGRDTNRDSAPDSGLDIGDAVAIERNSPAELHAALTAAWAGLEPAAVWASCVAGPAVEKIIAAVAGRVWNLQPAFIASPARQAGVVNSYPQPARLGGDRWAALVGARRMFPRRAVIVVDAGSAVTVDALDAGGVFRGGIILPGARAMREALRRQTANLGGPGDDGDSDSAGAGAGDGAGENDCAAPGPAAADVADATEVAPTVAATLATALATDTQAAVAGGAWLALAGGVERAVAAQLAALQSECTVIVTGGDAGRLAQLLSAGAECAPDLVLRGLAVIAAQSS
ncbi:MAG: type III pantothenate kinase [Gammaproteobacteria bacterium]|nr:type III pantothenate kinase [Gammaproteobacteria bacterium]